MKRVLPLCLFVSIWGILPVCANPLRSDPRSNHQPIFQNFSLDEINTVDILAIPIDHSELDIDQESNELEVISAAHHYNKSIP
jgi:hypothetical protein